MAGKGCSEAVRRAQLWSLPADLTESHIRVAGIPFSDRGRSCLGSGLYSPGLTEMCGQW